MTNVLKVIKKNPSNIIAALSCAGVITTGIVSFASGYKACLEMTGNGDNDPKKHIKRHIIVPIAVGGLTIASIITGNRIDAKTKMELAAGCAAIVQGVKNEVKKEIEDRKNPPFDISEKQTDEVVFFEEFSGRKFVSTLEEVHKAEQSVVNRYMSDGLATLNDFYEYLDLECTNAGEILGWMNLDFDAVDDSFGNFGDPQFMNQEVIDEETEEPYYKIKYAWDPYCLDRIEVPLD